jgi:diguanylate cyclase (GGDEF)-like protein
MWNSTLIVDVSVTLAGALMRTREFDPDVVIAPVDERLDGEYLCCQVKRIDTGRIVLLAYPFDRLEADQLAENAGADGWLLTPYNPGAVVCCVKWAVRLRDALRAVDQLRGDKDLAVLAPSRDSPQATKNEIEFFKRSLLMEVRRSRRYRYPLAFLCVGVDRFDGSLGRLPVHVRTREMAKLLGIIQGTVRDIDLAVQDGDQRFLVCLPQTDPDGARNAAERIRDLLPKGCEGVALAVSVGLACYDGSDTEISFKGLLTHARSCLKRAQSLGGDRVEGLT